MPVVHEVVGDAALINSTRAGDQTAVAALWRRHHHSAVLHARALVGASDAEDVASDAFTSVIGAITRGSGPDELFRPYLYTVIRNLAGDEFRRRARNTDREIDFDAFEDDTVDASAQMAQAADRSTLGRAFRSLPERWQSVLWYLDVEEMRPRHIAPLVDMKPGAVSSLAYRARQALRAAWVQEHLTLQSVPDECRKHLARFGAYETGTLAARDRRRFEAHVQGCADCPPVVEDARRLAARIAVAILPTAGGLAAARAVSTAAAPAPAASAASTSGHTVSHWAGRVAAAVAGSTALAVAIAVAVTAPLDGARLPGPLTWRADASDAPDALPATPLSPPQRTRPQPPSPAPAPAPARESPVLNVANETAAAPAQPDGQATDDSPLVAAPGPNPSPLPLPVPLPTAATDKPLPVTPTVPISPTSRSSSPVPSDSALLVADPAVVVSGTAAPGSRIMFRADGTRVATVADADGRWSAQLQFSADGAYRVTVTATASGRTESLPATVLITVDTTAPAPPTVATTWRDTDTAAPAFGGTAEPGSTVALSVIGKSAVTKTTAGEDGAWSATMPGLLPTDAGVQATATDAAGNTSAPTAGSAFAFAPTVTEPTDGATVSTGPIPVTISGWAGSSVAVSVDDTMIRTIIIGPDQQFSGYLHTFGHEGLPPGAHTITVSYVDGTTRSTVTFTVGE